jgi:Fe-S-cluster containining protein
MTGKKFLGKIRTDPWEALAKGPREVMASLWQDYLKELIQAEPQSRRAEILRKDIEAATEFPQVYDQWPEMTPKARADAWFTLVGAAKERAQALETCVRCGECCEKGSPALLLNDLDLLRREILTWTDVYTLRPGEPVTDREDKVAPLKEERLKVREVPGTRQCWFYLAASQSCRIYEDRPEQCRRQQCWSEPHPAPGPEELLNRGHLLKAVPEMAELMAAHEERCALARVEQALADLAAGREEAGDELFDALHFDHYLRQMLVHEWELPPAAVEFILGRPLSNYLEELGYSAELTPEGVFKLSPRAEPAG